LDEVLVTEPLGTYLGVALTVEEELSHLLLVEVSVLVQRCEDRHIARGEARQQLRQLALFGSEVGGRIWVAKQDRPVVDGEGPSAAATMPVRIRGRVRFQRRARAEKPETSPSCHPLTLKVDRLADPADQSREV